MTAEPIRALVVDDSTTARTLLVEILRDAGIQVVGEAADGERAVARTRELQPSIVVMDIEMPNLDGFGATKQIMAQIPTPIVIVTARHDPTDVAISLQATRVGALTVLPKPAGPSSPRFDADAARLAMLVRALADVKVVGRRGRTTPGPPVQHVAPTTGDRIRAVGVAASTGGPAALYRFVAALPLDLRAPVMVVQHIAEGFTAGLARWLDTSTELIVRIAEHGERVADGVVYIAPSGVHLEVDRSRSVRLSDGPPTDGFRPSASVLFESLAYAYGTAAAAVVLTGMGTDGLAGVRTVRDRGGVALAQDEATSAVFGMPRAVVDAQLANTVGPVEALAGEVARLTRTTAEPDRKEDR